MLSKAELRRIGIFLGIVLLVFLAFLGKNYYNESQENHRELKSKQEETRQEYLEAKELLNSDFSKLFTEDNEFYIYTGIPDDVDDLLSKKEAEDYKKIVKSLEKSEQLYNDMLEVGEDISKIDIVDASAKRSDAVSKKFTSETDSFSKEISQLPEGQQLFYKSMLADMKTEFEFYNQIYPTFFGDLPLFEVTPDNLYYIFGVEKNNEILKSANELVSESPVGYVYFGLDTIESDINQTFKEYGKNSARFINDIDKSERKGMVSSYWEREDGKYSLYIQNDSSEYIKFAEEAFSVYYDFSTMYFKTSQFSDTRKGLEELNRVDYGEKSRSGYTWHVFMLAPGEIKQVGSISKEKFEKFSYGTLQYEYQDKVLGFGVPDFVE